jgi:aminoglycoside/choline kinase family phosphotransferase
MNTNLVKDILTKLFESKFGVQPQSIKQLPRSGSDRVYYRMQHEGQSAIGAFNPDIMENRAFFHLTNIFCCKGLNVPELLLVAPDEMHYMVTDLGNETLYDRIKANEKAGEASKNLCLIKESLLELIRLQTAAASAIDYSQCYPREAFDRQSILWDLNYFKYEFLKMATIPFNEQLLENDFQQLADALTSNQSDFFMFRDFQSRNIMLLGDTPWFIDYQGGRRGPIQYDLASLLYSPKTGLNNIQRESYLLFFIEKLKEHFPVDENQFINDYYKFVLIRILQALGAYAFRGLYEGKTNFKSSIPAAIENLSYLQDNNLIPTEFAEIQQIIRSLKESKWAKKYQPEEGVLTILVRSFSYKKGIPADPTENGGGFVFDCRGLPNPGRNKEYRIQNGTDQEVIDYLEKYPEVSDFLFGVQSIVKISVKEYIARGFEHLCISFGCTGGQHRSVYNAEKISHWLANNFPVKVVLEHVEKNNWRQNE